MQLTHIEGLEIAVCLQLHFNGTHRQFLVEHRTNILRIRTTHASEIDDVALSYLPFADQRELTRILIIEGIHIHTIS